MQPYDVAIPTLPCRSVSATVEFYKSLGFEAAHTSSIASTPYCGEEPSNCTSSHTSNLCQPSHPPAAISAS